MISRLFIFILAAWLLVIAGYVKADTIPATQGSVTYNYNIFGGSFTPSTYSSFDSACQAALGPANTYIGNQGYSWRLSYKNSTTVYQTDWNYCTGIRNDTGADFQYGTSAKGGGQYSCPSNYTLSGTSCTLNTSTTACSSKTGALAATLLVDVGTNAEGLPPPGDCISSCQATIGNINYPYNRVLVNGVAHYQTTVTYGYTGAVCGANAPTINAVPAGQQADTCPAGQIMASGTFNGVTRSYCYDQSTGKMQNPNAPCSDVIHTFSAVTNADGGTSTTTQTMHCDGSTSQDTVTTHPDGTKDQVKSNTPAPNSSSGNNPSTGGPSGSGGSSGGGSGSGSGPGSSPNNPVYTAPVNTPPGSSPQNPDYSDICTKNPNIDACKNTQPGSASFTGGLYTKDSSGKTFQSSINNFKSTIQTAGFYSAANSFFTFSASTGSCSGLDGSWSIFGHSMTANMSSVFCSSTAQSAYVLLAIGVMIGALYVAFRVAIL